MRRINPLFLSATVCGLLVFTAHAQAEGTVTGANGVSLSIYANPFDPNEDFNASETTASYGDPTTGLPGIWSIGSPDGKVTHAVDRQDGRGFAGNTASYIYTYADTTGPAAFFQFTAPSTFRVGTVLTSHDVYFGGYTTSQPLTLQFNNGALGTTAAAWSAVTPLMSDPGTLGLSPIVVTQDFTPFTADTVRVAFSSTSQAGSNSQASIQEIVALPDSMKQLNTSAGASTGLSGVGIVDNQGGPYSTDDFATTQNGLWYDIGTPVATNMFFTINVLDPLPIDAMVLYGDEASPGEEFDIFDDANVKIGHVTFDAAYPGEVLPIRFDTPVLTTSLRFQITSAPIYSGSQSIASMREVVLLTDTPEPASGTLLAAAAVMMLRRRGRPATVKYAASNPGCASTHIALR